MDNPNESISPRMALLLQQRAVLRTALAAVLEFGDSDMDEDDMVKAIRMLGDKALTQVTELEGDYERARQTADRPAEGDAGGEKPVYFGDQVPLDARCGAKGDASLRYGDDLADVVGTAAALARAAGKD